MWRKKLLIYNIHLTGLLFSVFLKTCDQSFLHLFVFQKKNSQVFRSRFGICPLQQPDRLHCKILHWKIFSIFYLVKNGNKNIETKFRSLFKLFFYQPFFWPKTNFKPLTRNQLHSPDVNHKPISSVTLRSPGAS